MRSCRTVFAAVAALVFSAASAEATIVMDFEDLALADDQTHKWGITYTAGDWVLNSRLLPGFPIGSPGIENEFRTYGTQDIDFQGSTAVTTSFFSDFAIYDFERLDGAVFAMESIMVASASNGQSTPFEFVGILDDVGGTVTRPFQTSGDPGFETVTFIDEDWARIERFEIYFKNFDGQIDNIAIVPEPGTALLMGLGLAGLGLTGRSRREEGQGAA